ncbi:MAG: peptidase S8 [Microcystis aeruginosa LG13-03]|nr:peptidase S8 [Microcystis aeruginosa LG13-13]NCR02921.1 peptidase S8 [Microcystis aeruginosa LG13-03]NCR61037.1 peptidase S8 [Microcystis aeruginosa LG11-05]
MKKLLLLTLFIIGLGFALFNFTGLANRGEYQSILIDFKDDIPVSVLDEQLNTVNKKAGKTTSLNSIFSIDEHLYTVDGDSKLLKTLRNSDLKKYTESIEPDYIYHAFIAPNDPDYSKQWNLRGINIERAWEENHGEGITVAVIDTGVSQVPDLRETEFVEGYDFVNDRSNAEDDNGHGTHVAGTIAQSTNNNYGVAGIAYKAKIMPLKVLSGTGGGTVADIAEAIRFAVDNKADVINMSLGGGGETQVMKDAIEYAYSKGVVIVAAAGNADDNSAAYPARFPHVIGVSAVDASGNKAPYSNFGAGIDIAAPGGSDTGKIIQETIDPAQGGEPAFLGFQGTSMAAPHVAGVVALIKAAGIKEPSAVLEVLQQSARKINDDPFNHFGAGQLDAGNALQLALKGQITFRDFWRWLRDNGYLNPRFWIDGGAVAVLPKMAMVLGSYLLAWWLRSYFPFSWNGFLNAGLIFGSSGLFFLRGLYIFDLPQWPFRVMGSSLSDLGGVIQGSSALNPLFASVILPFVLIALLLGHPQAKWLAVGVTLAMAVTLGISAVIHPTLIWLGSGTSAQAFLGVNALLCLGLGYLALKSATSSRYA